MQVNFFDDKLRTDLFPLTLTRPAAELKCGILTISQKWQHALQLESWGYKSANYLSETFKEIKTPLYINGRVLPSATLVNAISKMTQGDYLSIGDTVVAYHTTTSNRLSLTEDLLSIDRVYDIFSMNGVEIEKDFETLTAGKKSGNLHDSNTVIGSGKVFLEKGAEVYVSVLNTTKGSIYLAAKSQVMEGSMIRGPFSLGEESTIKMGAKIYGDTSVGNHCKVGGEVSNSVIFDFSNKAHDGFLGNSVLGQWCNLGADTNNSNLKNNYDEVKLWNYNQDKFEKTGLQFCGLIMGDHSKTAINTMFNTGTVIGVSCNLFGAGFPRNFVPSFAWGGAAGFSTYQIGKAKETAKLVYQRRGLQFDIDDEHILEHLFTEEKKYRFWENKE